LFQDRFGYNVEPVNPEFSNKTVFPLGEGFTAKARGGWGGDILFSRLYSQDAWGWAAAFDFLPFAQKRCPKRASKNELNAIFDNFFELFSDLMVQHNRYSDF
jgi:hypothetical protein